MLSQLPVTAPSAQLVHEQVGPSDEVSNLWSIHAFCDRNSVVHGSYEGDEALTKEHSNGLEVFNFNSCIVPFLGLIHPTQNFVKRRWLRRVDPSRPATQARH